MPKIEVDLPDATLRDIDKLAKKKKISRTEALVEAVTTTKELAEKAPYGARIVPLNRIQARKAK